MVERILIQDRATWLRNRKRAINASEIGGLFNCHTYQSQLQLWLDKRNHPAGDRPVDPNTVRRGRIFETGVAEAVREDRPDWTITKADYYLFEELFRPLIDGEPTSVGLGATPDFLVHCPRRGEGILQAKTTIPLVFEQHWTPEVPPLWIILQAQQEMMLQNVNWGAIAVLVLDPWTWPCYIYEMEARPDLHQEIKDAAARFWLSVERGIQPLADPARDADTIKRLYPKDNGDVIDLSSDNMLPALIDRYFDIKDKLKDAAAIRKELDAVETEIKSKIGDNFGALTRSWEIALPTISRKSYQVAETSYRQLKIKPRAA